MDPTLHNKMMGDMLRNKVSGCGDGEKAKTRQSPGMVVLEKTGATLSEINHYLQRWMGVAHARLMDHNNE